MKYMKLGQILIFSGVCHIFLGDKDITIILGAETKNNNFLTVKYSDREGRVGCRDPVRIRTLQQFKPLDPDPNQSQMQAGSGSKGIQGIESCEI